MTKVINIFGAPGVGKSTFAASLFAEMKKNGFCCELVQEFAKEVVYSDNKNIQNDQLIILAEQYRRTFILNNKVDYIITDSPIALSAIYNELTTKPYPKKQFNEICFNAFNRFENRNILLTHKAMREYEKNGRIHSYNQSLEIQKVIQNLLDTHSIRYIKNPTITDLILKLKQTKNTTKTNNNNCSLTQGM